MTTVSGEGFENKRGGTASTASPPHKKAPD
jgi:hypothetical protein